VERASDEVRSWFGDDEAERRRERERVDWRERERERGDWSAPDRGRGLEAAGWARQWGYVQGPYAPGRYTGRGPRGWQRPDERIEDDVCERLEQRGDVDAIDVEVRGQNREVTLEGTVNSRWEKRIAEDIAESVGGVTEVHNRLRARRAGAEGEIEQARRETAMPATRAQTAGQQPTGAARRRAA